MPDARLKYLFDQYLAKTCTQAERQELAELVLTAQHDEAIAGLLQQSWDSIVAEEDINEEKASGIMHFILQEKPVAKDKNQAMETPVRKMINWRKIAAVAAIFILLTGIGYFLLFNKPGKNGEIVKTMDEVKDIAAPKGSKAMITLSNGQTILLDSITNGMLAKQGNVNVVKTTDGRIIYSGDNSEMVYNTLFNPRGSEVVNLTLSDGTKVWLNSESSLRYPVAFAGNERKVEITGEAYFEVTKDPARKFIVTANDVTTEVLGTHFNVNSYSDEASIKITLLEGSVKVIKKGVTSLLKPGQQAQAGAEVKIANDINTEEVMAWKEGKFQFGEKSDIAGIMRQLSRWYNVEAEYKGTVTGHIGGGISRNVNISQVLKMLETTGVAKFRMEGRKVIVSP